MEEIKKEPKKTKGRKNAVSEETPKNMDIENALKGDAGTIETVEKDGKVIVSTVNLPEEPENDNVSETEEFISQMDDIAKMSAELDSKRQNLEEAMENDPSKIMDNLSDEIKKMEGIKEKLEKKLSESKNNYTKIWSGINYGL